jgi:hypothetical protein
MYWRRIFFIKFFACLKDPDLDPYKINTDPDPGAQKTYGSFLQYPDPEHWSKRSVWADPDPGF